VTFCKTNFQNFFQVFNFGHFKNVQNPFPFLLFGKEK
jgi:hypothetical protein